ncbi:hypothetical protein D3C77_628880 [compost metagenome]
MATIHMTVSDTNIVYLVSPTAFNAFPSVIFRTLAGCSARFIQSSDPQISNIPSSCVNKPNICLPNRTRSQVLIMTSGSPADNERYTAL